MVLGGDVWTLALSCVCRTVSTLFSKCFKHRSLPHHLSGSGMNSQTLSNLTRSSSFGSVTMCSMQVVLSSFIMLWVTCHSSVPWLPLISSSLIQFVKITASCRHIKGRSLAASPSTLAMSAELLEACRTRFLPHLVAS